MTNTDGFIFYEIGGINGIGIGIRKYQNRLYLCSAIGNSSISEGFRTDGYINKDSNDYSNTLYVNRINLPL